MHLSNNTTTPSIAAHRLLRHFPRDATGHGFRHITILIIAVSAAVGGLLLALVFWRIFSRRSRRVPFPPRQAPVYQRELQLLAFTEHSASLPQVLPDDHPSRSSWVPYVRDSLANTSTATSSASPEADEKHEAAPLSSYGVHLHPPTPTFSPPRIPSSSSSTSLPLFNGRSSPSSDTHSPTTISHSVSHGPSPRPAIDRLRSRQRPVSMVSIGTSHTTMTVRSRLSTRGAPHSHHNNIQIVLPAPLASELYKHPTSEEPRVYSPVPGNSTYQDSWRSSLADKWIPVGQHGMPEPESVGRQHSRDSAKRRSLLRRGPSPVSLAPRRRSNSSPLSRSSRQSLDNSPQDNPPPVPRVPSEHETPSRRHRRTSSEIQEPTA